MLTGAKDKTQATTPKAEANRLEALVKIARNRASSGAAIYDDAEDLISGLHSVARQQRYNSETEVAMRESREIMVDGKIRAEVYDSAEDLLYALDGCWLCPSR